MGGSHVAPYIRPMQNIDNKIVVVTGASSGIGRAIAIELAGHGARVVLSARSEASLSQVVDEITAAGGQAVAKTAEVHRRDDVAALVDYAVATYGRLDVFVCNAGIAPISPLADLRVDDWDAMVDVNLKGALNAVAAALPVFLDQGSGHFVFTVSTAGLVMIPSMAVYAATKNAVRTLVEGLRIESEGRYRVTGVSPGFVATNLAKSMPDENVRRSIEKTMGEIALDPADIARAVGFAISQPSHVDVNNIVVQPAVQG
jgi:NADP-dependent 3-hydroxy acid dehydrogenase YdfG